MRGCRFLIAGGLGALLVLGCAKEQKPAPPPESARPMPPWTYHRLGGLLVIEGEVDRPTELVLKGTTLNETRYAEFGPVRWEMFRPPPGEVAELRTRDGRLLAKWDLDQPAPQPPVPAAQEKPVPRPRTEPQAPSKAKPVPPQPRTAPPKLVQPKPMQPKPAPPKPQATPPPKPAPKPREKAPSPVPPKVAAPARPQPMPPASARGTWPGAGEGANLLRGSQGQQRVCLTFDGGSTAEVAADVLDTLKARGIRTTFFLTGQFIQRFPDLVRRMDREGHEIGNHTMDHPHLAPRGARDPRWTRERFQRELLDADEELYRLLGHPMEPIWRAPYGEQTAELRRWAEEVGYRHVGWSEGADTLDWATPRERKLYRTGNAILDRLHERMQKKDGDGLIVLMHLGSARPEVDRPARVLGPFLDRARREGWTFVKVGAYLEDTGRPRWESGNRLSLLVRTGAGGSGGSAAHQR